MYCIHDIKAVPVCLHCACRGQHAGLLFVVLTHSLLGFGLTLSLLGVWGSPCLCVYPPLCQWAQPIQHMCAGTVGLLGVTRVPHPGVYRVPELTYLCG